MTVTECPLGASTCISVDFGVQGTGVRVASALALTSSANPSLGGRNVTFKAKITAPGSATPTGNVTFTDGATTLATLPLDANGRAIFATTSLTVGSHTITATYTGDALFTGSSDSLTQTVN